MKAQRVLIYRLGSLGDTLVALPCFHAIADAFPGAERVVLTNFPVDPRAPTLSSVLDHTRLVHGYIEYPVRLRGLSQLRNLRRKILEFRPDVVVYLTPFRGRAQVWRDAMFFKLCGNPRIIGVPYSNDVSIHRWIVGEGRFEREAARLARTIASAIPVDLNSRASWSLNLTVQEREIARRMIGDWARGGSFLTISVGTKVAFKDWGKRNWEELVELLSAPLISLPVVFLGAESERDYTAAIASHFAGQSLNLCGQLNPREAAAVLERSLLFVGHDSGPMHLASAVGTETVAIFSGHNLPGVWFPWGEGHVVFYPEGSCDDYPQCQCNSQSGRCIRSISPRAVEDAIRRKLGERVPGAPAIASEYS